MLGQPSQAEDPDTASPDSGESPKRDMNDMDQDGVTNLHDIGWLRRVLLDLARREDDLAASEAALQPYWKACSPSVHGHRVAATALRAEADRWIEAVLPVLRAGSRDDFPVWTPR